MTNTNCLEGICCPKCGNEDRLMIVATVVAEVTDDGADVASPMYGNGFEWDDESRCRCPECDFEGKLKGFRKLPPDADGMNEKRAAWAGAALAAFITQTGTDEENAVGDLLGDLMHWCDCNNYDFEAALARARGHYEAETAGGEAEPLGEAVTPIAQATGGQHDY